MSTYEREIGGLVVCQQPTGWAVTHAGSGLTAAKGLRQRRFAEEARGELLATGVDFTREARAIAADHKQWADVYYRWQHRAHQVSFDEATGEYYNQHTSIGTFIPSAAWAQAYRTALATRNPVQLEALLHERYRYRADNGDADTGCRRHGRTTGCFGRWGNCLPYETRPQEQED